MRVVVLLPNKVDYMKIAVGIAMDAIREAQEEFKAVVAKEIMDEHSSEKKRGWAAEIAASMVSEEPYYDEKANKIVGKVFLPEDHDDNNYVRAMVLAEGNQAEGPLHTKPGEKTWDGNITEKRVHVAEGAASRLLPESFNFDSGTNFMMNAATLYQDKFIDKVNNVQKKIQKKIDEEMGKMQ